jgi:hypothetical protein
MGEPMSIVNAYGYVVRKTREGGGTIRNWYLIKDTSLHVGNINFTKEWKGKKVMIKIEEVKNQPPKPMEEKT